MAEDFKQQIIPFGRGTLDLQRPVGDVAPENYSRILNVFRRQDGLLTGRPGLVSLLLGLDGQGRIISIARLNESTAAGFAHDPLGLTPVGVRFIGTDAGNLYYAPRDTAFLLAGGFSTSPLITLPYRPPLAARAWLYIADSLQMRKVAPESITEALILPIGLPAPGNPDARMPMDEFPPELYFGGWDGSLDLRQIANFTLFGFEGVEGASPMLVEVQPAASTIIDRCESAAPWTVNAGSGGAPTVVADAVNFKEGLASLKFTSNAGAAAGLYYNFFNRALSLDLTRVGSLAATDEDHIHGWIRCDRPDLLTELRLYFILGSDYSAAALPGTSSTANSNFYAKAIKASDFTNFLEGSASALAAQTQQNTNTQTQQAGGGQSSTAGVPPLAGGRSIWTEFGALEFPLRRGEFKRYGADESLDWSDVTGLVFMIFTNTNQVVNVWLDDLRLSGGSGPDSSITGNVPYDYRYRNYDPRTGVRGNPCPVSLEQFWVDAVRQAIKVKPQEYGDSEIRQQIFRRGGSLTRNWYFVGVNGADGQELTDEHSDNSLLNAEILEEDNDQPVTTVDAAGNLVLAQPLHTIFGPVDDVIFGLGDPNRKGDVYWSKKGDADAWPRFNHRELCGSSEELIAGYVGVNQPYCMSRERGFVLYPNLGGDGQLGYAPTGCTRGPLSRTAYAVGPKGDCFFAARDGFYRTNGGPEQCLSDDWIRPIFYGYSANGFLPIDFQRADDMRVSVHGTDVWFVYVDTVGTYRVLIWSLDMQYWRPYKFPPARGIFSIYSEPAQPLNLLLGGTNKLYYHGGTSDDGVAVTGIYRSGALDQGNQRNWKLYGDLWVHLDRKGQDVTCSLLADDEQVSLGDTLINSGSGLGEYILDPFETPSEFGAPGPQQTHSISLEVSWESSEAPPLLREWALSYIIQPEITKGRPTDWDSQGRLTDKMVKGLHLECDTGGLDKTLIIEADGVAVKTITVNHAGRLSRAYAWTEFEGRLLRFNPVDTVGWVVYNHRWIFDEEPAQLTRWETQLVDHGLTIWHMLPVAYITYRTPTGEAHGVTLEIEVYDQSGTLTQTLVPTPLLSSTAGKKIKRYVGFPAAKGCFYKYIFSSSGRFWLYKPESKVFCQPWDGSAGQWVVPWGDDDLDGVRGLRDAGLGAARGGGGES